ncbi:MAG: hypothetical protein OHK0029_05480 [Armatimonadaceae bacterium]
MTETLLAGALLVWLQGQSGEKTDARTEELVQEVHDRINQERKKQNRPPLTLNDRLNAAARKHSERMAKEQFFDHTDKRGDGPAERVNQERYQWVRVGENIAMNSGYKNPAEQAVAGWMKSPGHRRNILDGEFTETGIGIAYRGKAIYFTQVFARPGRF